MTFLSTEDEGVWPFADANQIFRAALLNWQVTASWICSFVQDHWNVLYCNCLLGICKQNLLVMFLYNSCLQGNIKNTWLTARSPKFCLNFLHRNMCECAMYSTSESQTHPGGMRHTLFILYHSFFFCFFL